MEIEQTENLLSRLETLNDPSTLLIKCQGLLKEYKVDQAFEISKLILEQDYFNFQNLIIHAELLLNRNQLSELYNCCSNLAENYPSHFVTLHCFGCYYLLLGQTDQA